MPYSAVAARLTLAGSALLLLAAGPGPVAGPGPEKQGMPQLDFANPLTTSQVVWGGLIFVLLYGLLSRWALPKVSEVVEARQFSIAGDLETARQAKAQADGAIAELRAATQRARAEAQAAIADATQRAKAEAAARASESNQRLDAQLAEAEGRIGAARNAAMGALSEVAGETATTVITRLTGQSPAAGAVDHAVTGLLAARGQG